MPTTIPTTILTAILATYTYRSLLTAHYAMPVLLTTHSPAYDSLLTTHDSRLTTHDSRLTTHHRAFVDGLFEFTSSEDIFPLDDSCVGRRCSDGRPCRRVAHCLLEGMGGVASLGHDYSGAWANPWTFVITVIDARGASLAITPPTADLDVGATQRYPVLNLSRALGLSQRSPLVGRAVNNGFGDKMYFWDGYDTLAPTWYADTPVELCQRAGKSDAWCSYARFLHVPPVPTNVTITAHRLEPVIGGTQVRLRCTHM